MKTIVFKENELSQSIRTDEKPVYEILRLTFSTIDLLWVNRLIKTSIFISSKCFNRKDIEIYSHSISIPIIITPYHIQPIIEIQRRENFVSSLYTKDVVNNQFYWITTIELKEIELKENEVISLSILEREHIIARVEDWKSRINNLFDQINEWIRSLEGFESKIGHQVQMSEELMTVFEIPIQKINTLEVYKGKTLILAFKPKALWTIAANGRIDIISLKGSFMLVDFSEHFQKPQWNIYTSDKKNKLIFNQDAFFNILSIITK